MNKKTSKIVAYLAGIVAAAILLQTLFFKFTAHPDSVYIFSQLGMEPWGRIGVGVLELITGMMLLYPRTTKYGGLLGMGVISGALFFHLFVLGVNVNNDGGLLFGLAVAVFASCFLIVIIKCKELWREMVVVIKKTREAVVS